MNGDTSINNFPMGDKPQSRGPLLGTIVIVLIIIVGGIYIASSRRAEVPPGLPPDQSDTNVIGNEPAGVTPTVDSQAAALDGLNALENEINSNEADLQSLDNELK